MTRNRTHPIMRTRLALCITATALVGAGCASTPFDDIAMPMAKAYVEPAGGSGHESG